ncbi:atlastin-2-like [Chironomus tepperi]|uniref:atlastin-2-like n=1 Tax=Chironomus tepperi TaxID=113505 RepID=UPI00391F19F1
MAQNLIHPVGSPVSILTFSDDNQVIINNDKLNEIFDHEDIQDHDNWMGAGNESLTGFSWRSGSRRETTGIIMWNDVFLHTLDKTDEKIAIFVMDTQGLFDNDSPSANNLKIFAMGTLISSIPIFNLMNHIQEDHLEYLQFATKLAQHTVTVKETMYGKIFQNLMFLVRDWSNSDEYQYGVNGGKEYIEYILRPRLERRDVVQTIIETINQSFDQVRCCLLPHPGLGVTNNRNYDGNWSAMDGNFKDEMKNFIESILLPDNLMTKKINGMDINVMTMKQYILAYFLLFQSGDFPGASSIYQLTVEKFMNVVIEKCINEYRLTMFRNMDLKLSNIHESCKARALIMFDAERQMGSDEFIRKSRNLLEQKMNEIFEDFEKITEDDRKKLQAALDKEQEIILEAERAKKELEDALIKIEEEKMNNKINAEDYNRKKQMYEDRIKLKDEQIQDGIQKKQEYEEFRRTLIPLAAAATITATAIGLIITTGQQVDVVGTVMNEVTDVGNVIAAGAEIVEYTGTEIVDEVATATSVGVLSFLSSSLIGTVGSILLLTVSVAYAFAKNS